MLGNQETSSNHDEIYFKIGGSIIEQNGGFELDIANIINVSWEKWRQARGVRSDI